MPKLKIDYPLWKEIVWRYVRVFVASFVSALTVDQLLSVDKDIYTSALKAALAATLVAVSKALREEQPKDGLLNKLPV